MEEDPSPSSGTPDPASPTAAGAAGSAAPAAPGTPPAAGTKPTAGPATPWEGPTPDVITWLLVNWHNRHPLARRIGVQDVHTIGAVALPFLAQALPREPSLDAAPAPDTPGTPPAKPGLLAKLGLGRLLARHKAGGAGGGPRPLWSEQFIPGLKPAQVAALALDHGFTSAPDELPLRRIDINPQLAAGDTNQSGAWPMELVVLSAAIDADGARSRVLIGRRDKVLGARSMDPMRLAIVGAVGVLLLAVLAWALWPASKKHAEGETAPAPAASAASAPLVAASTPALAASEAASAPSTASAASAASAAEGEASAPALPGSAPQAASASR